MAAFGGNCTSIGLFSAAREPRGAKGEESRCKDEAEPYSFSRLDLSTAPKELAAHFPDFPGISAALQVDVHAGL